jgi:hypothetical protein
VRVIGTSDRSLFRLLGSRDRARGLSPGYHPNMGSLERREKPQLTEFLDGHPGPPAIEYRGGKVKVIAAVIYTDGIAIEWFVGPVPDLSWMPEDSSEGSSSFFSQFRDQPEKIAYSGESDQSFRSFRSPRRRRPH